MSDESKRPDPEFAIGDVYIANLRYKDRDGNPRPHGEKRRPVVVLYDFTKKGKAFYMITSTVTGYLSEQFGCEIKDLKAAGLDKPSVVRMGRGQRYDIWEANPLGRKIGELSIKDLVRVVDAFERVTRHERTRTQEQIENAKTLEKNKEQQQKKNDFEPDR